MRRRKREFQTSELMKGFTKALGIERQLIGFEARQYLSTQISEALFREIIRGKMVGTTLYLQVCSPLAAYELQLRSTDLLEKIQRKFGAEEITELIFIQRRVR